MSESDPSTARPAENNGDHDVAESDGTQVDDPRTAASEMVDSQTQGARPEATLLLSESAIADATLIGESGSQQPTVDFSQWSGPQDGSAGPEETLRAPHDLKSLGLEIELDDEHEQIAGDGVTAARDAGFSVESVLGEGGMGTVFAGRQNSMDRPVAIKVLKGDAANAGVAHELFVSEAIITGSLITPTSCRSTMSAGRIGRRRSMR